MSEQNAFIDAIKAHTEKVKKMTRAEARAHLKKLGHRFCKTVQVPQRHWPLLRGIIARRPDDSGSSLHVAEDVWRFGRGRALRVFYLIGSNSDEPDEIEIETEEDA